MKYEDRPFCACGCGKRVHLYYGKPQIDITFNEAIFIMKQECSYCGIQPNRKVEVGEYSIMIHGIDRIDSTKGYERNNIHSACEHCNTAKLDYTETEFLQLIERVYYNRFIKPNLGY